VRFVYSVYADEVMYRAYLAISMVRRSKMSTVRKIAAQMAQR